MFGAIRDLLNELLDHAINILYFVAFHLNQRTCWIFDIRPCMPCRPPLNFSPSQIRNLLSTLTKLSIGAAQERHLGLGLRWSWSIPVPNSIDIGVIFVCL